jgi:LuxR family transcriptional regulator, maltose regulon positive regulatory protein
MDRAVFDKGAYWFGSFALDPAGRKLTCQGHPLRLTARPFDLLLYAVQNAGRTIEKDELLTAVWGDRAIEETNLSQTIHVLRRALRDAGGEDPFVTIPGRGYRFVAEVMHEAHGSLRQAGNGSGKPFEERDARQLTVAAPAQRTRLAKLSPPRLPDTVARLRLFAMLEQCRQRKIVWVAGPPGAGKTTLVRSFLNAAGTPCIWYLVDAGDSDPASFFYYLREAARDAGAQIAQVPLLTAEYLQDITGYTRRFFRTFVDRLPHPLVLVLDNFQEADAASVLSDILRDAAGELGPDASMIVISRQEPPAAFARLRANQELALLGWEELRLTETETGTIVARQTPHLAPMAQAMHARSDGWAAGLTLLLESGRSGGDMHVAEVLETPQALVDYFVTELFARAPEPLRLLCLSTALLPRFTAAAAVVLSGQEDAGQLLDGLARRRMFTDRYVADEVHYQYHALFREFLGQQVDRLFSSEARRDLTQRSAHTAEAAGDPETALSLYATVGDWNEAARLVLAQAPDLFAQGRWQTLQTWLSCQPAQSFTERPWLTYWLGLCQGQTNPAAGRASVANAFKGFELDGDVRGQALSVCAIVESHLVNWLEIVGVERWIDVLERIVAQQLPYQSAAVDLRVHSVMLLALSYFKPQHELAAVCIRRVWSLCHADIGAGERIMAASSLVLSLAWGGSPPIAAAAVAEFDHLTTSPNITPLQRCTWLSGKCYISLMNGDFVAYGLDWQAAGRLAAEGGLHFMAAMCRLQYVWQPLLEGAMADAEDCLRLIELKPNDSPILFIFYEMLCAWLALLKDQTDIALERSEKLLMILLPSGSKSLRRVVCLNVCAHALAASGHWARALAIAREATSWFPQPGQGAIQFVSLLTEADVLRGMGRRDEYLKVLADAFATGRRGGHYVTIPWLPKVVTRLAATALQEGIELDYVRELVRRRNLPLDLQD